jgi:hypothetical protein
VTRPANRADQIAYYMPDFIMPIFCAFIRCILQARMSPFDIDVLAIPTSFDIIILFDPSAIVPIMLLTFIIPSPEQVIIAADAGVTAKAARAAVTIRYFIVELSLEKPAGLPAFQGTLRAIATFRVDEYFWSDQY